LAVGQETSDKTVPSPVTSKAGQMDRTNHKTFMHDILAAIERQEAYRLKTESYSNIKIISCRHSAQLS